MATVLVTPTTVAQDLDTLATALAAEANISAATEDIDVPEGMNGRKAVRVTGTASVDITNAIAAVGNVEILEGSAIV